MRVILFACLWMLAGAASFATPLYAVCGAYGPELSALKAEFGVDEAKGWTRTTVKGVDFWRGTFAGKDLLVFRTGVSVVNAASRLQLALDNFPITHVLFAGVAGGIDPSLSVGDVVVPAQWAYHDEMAFLNEDGHGGYVFPSFVPKSSIPNYGMMFPHGVSVTPATGKGDEYKPAFNADPALLTAARSALPRLPVLKTAGREVRVVVGGVGVSGSVFLDNAPYREWVFRTWHAECVDMESTALAQVAYVNAKPVLIVRALSDLAGGQHGANPIGENELSVSQLATRVLRSVIEAL